MKTYVTAQGDTYDQISLKEYGTEYAVRDLIAENAFLNPMLATVWRFPAGVTLKIPELKAGAADYLELPPWRRPDD